MKKGLSIIFGLFLLFSINFIFAAEENLTTLEKAESCINSSQTIISDLQANNFSVIRVNDSYNEVYSLYLAQLSLETKQKGRGDFLSIIKKCGDLENLHQMAFESRDSILSLRKFYNESLTSQMDTSSVDSLIIEIDLEIQNERYEKVPSLIDGAYAQISKIRAENTQLTLFYKSTAKGFVNFVYVHKIGIVILISFLIVVFLVYHTAFRKWRLNKKIAALNLRKESLKNLIRKTQTTFFQGGQMSEADYNMRVKNFAEMVRDIDRQIPLLNEEYLKLSRKAVK